jgi:hypothetical protein
VPADAVIDEVTRRANGVLQRVMLALARELRTRIRELDTKDGRFIRDQARATQALADDVREMARRRVPGVIQTIVDDLSRVLEETLADHPQLGAYRPEVTQDLVKLFRGGAEEIARDITEGAADEVARAMERVIGAGARIEDAAGPVATALSTTRARASVAIERAVREFNERTIAEMGKRSEVPMLYQYVGPPETSPNIRPYCAARTGRVLTQEQVDDLDPRERFRCRHSIAPLLPEDAAGLPRFRG